MNSFLFTLALIVFIPSIIFSVNGLFKYWWRIPLHRLSTRPLPIVDSESSGRHFMRWYQLFPGGVSDENDSEYYKRRGQDMMNIVHVLEDKKGFPFPDEMLMVISYNHESKQKSLFIGAPVDEDTIKDWGRNQFVTVRAVDIDKVPLPEHVSRDSIAVANTTKERYQNLKMTATRNDIGAVTSRIFDPDSMECDAVALLEVKRMSGRESGRFQFASVDKEEDETGKNNIALFGSGKKITGFANSKNARATLCIVVDGDADSKKAQSILDSLQSRFSSIPYEYEGQPLHLNLMRDNFVSITIPTIVFTVIFSLIAGIAGDMHTLILALSSLAVALVANGLAYLIPFFAVGPFAYTMKRGYIAQPPFKVINLKYQWMKMVKMKGRTGFFSRMIQSRPLPLTTDRHILPLNDVALTQFFTFPPSTQLENFVQSDSPIIGYPYGNQQTFQLMKDKILMGVSITGQPVYRDMELLESGVTFAGGTNTGKTNAMINYYVGVARKCYHNSRGAKITPIWLNTKEKNAQDIKDALTPVFGKPFTKPCKYVVVDTENPHLKFRLSLEGRTVVNPSKTDKNGHPIKGQYVYKDEIPFTDLKRNIGNITAGINALFGDAIRDESKMWLSNIVTIAMLLQPWEIVNMSKGRLDSELSLANFVGCADSDLKGHAVQQPNFMNLCYAIAGGWESFDPISGFQDLQKEWDNNFNDYTIGGHSPEWERDRRTLLSKAMVKFISPTKHAGRGSALEKTRPILNKFHALSEYSALWDNYTPDGHFRRILTPKELILLHRPVVINLSGYKNPDGTFEDSGADMVKEQYTVLIHTLLWETMKQSLVDGAGNFYPIFCDEITNLAPMLDDSGARSNITRMLEDVKEKGRSKGVTHMLGFQNYAQLRKIGVLDSLMGVESNVIFRLPQSSIEIEEKIAHNAQENDFPVSALERFPRGTAMTELKLTPSGHERTPFFTMRVPVKEDYIRALVQLRNEHKSLDFPERDVFRKVVHSLRKKGLIATDSN